MDIPFILALLGGAIIYGAFAFSIIRIILEGEWQRREVHSCGFHSLVRTGRVCGFCGARDKDWEWKTMRAKWPWGWEVKP